jgi:hypothetical protein
MGRELLDDRLGLGIMTLLETSARLNAEGVASALSTLPTGIIIFGQLLNSLGKWYTEDSEEQERKSLVTNDAFKSFVAGGCSSRLWTIPNSVLSGGQKVTLVKALDAALYSLLNTGSDIVDSSDIAVSAYTDLCEALGSAKRHIEMAEIGPECDEPVTDEISALHSRILVDLDALQMLLDKGGNGVVDALLGANAVDTLVPALVHAHEHLPQVSKLSKISNELDSYTAEPRDFPSVKSGLIGVLTALTKGNPIVQNRMRELHGLEAVLSNCVIDLNNPCKLWSLLMFSYPICVNLSYQRKEYIMC